MSHPKWPMVPLGELVSKSDERVMVESDNEYPNFGIYNRGRGLFEKPPISGSTSSASSLFRAKANQFVYSRLFAFEGSYGLVPGEFDGHFVSNEFPLFDCNESKLLPEFLGWYFRNPKTWSEVALHTTGMGSRRQRIKPEAFLKYSIQVPTIPEQLRIVNTINRLNSMVDHACELSDQVSFQTTTLLRSAFNEITAGSPRVRLEEVAPLVRRPADISLEIDYPLVSVRSFGRGTFHSGKLKGNEITWQKPFLVKENDILVSNIKAWEGAIAVAGAADDSRFGSHRYLTFVANQELATPHFICFYLLSGEGLLAVGEASPGSADRNRTLRVSAMLDIEIPLPSIEKQEMFTRLILKSAKVEHYRSDTNRVRQAMMPSILDRVFKGEL
ncbi:hypothetical protein [Rhodopirellula europaea]|uniref:hypothetical protein n=1 Tax=Rhodopirellula europaea TaxID=1263866 RepID=UPI003D2AAC89